MRWKNANSQHGGRRRTKEIAKVGDELTKVRAKLANPSFAEKVPAAVLEEHRQRETAWAEKLAQLHRMLAALGQSKPTLQL